MTAPLNLTVAEVDVEVHEADEWAAVYVNGDLVRQGDTHLADEWIRDYFGVKTVQDNAFLRGGNGRDETAKTLTEVKAYAEDRAARKAKAAELRAQANALLGEASELDQ